MTHCPNNYSEILTVVASGAQAKDLHHHLKYTFTHYMQRTYASFDVADYDPAQFQGDAVISWSGNDFTEWDGSLKRWRTMSDFPQSKRYDVESFCSYLAEFKNALVIGFGSDENWSLDGFEDMAYNEGGFPLFTRNIPLINPKHAYNLFEHRSRTDERTQEVKKDEFHFASGEQNDELCGKNVCEHLQLLERGQIHEG